MARRLSQLSVLALLLVTVGQGTAITHPGSASQVLEPDRSKTDQQRQGQEQWPQQQIQGSAQWPQQQTQGPAQWPGQQPQEPAQWSGQQPQGPTPWPGQQPQGPTPWPGQPQGLAQWPGQQPQGPVQWPGQQPQGPVQWPEQQTPDPPQWPSQQGQEHSNTQQGHGNGQWNSQNQEQSPVQGFEIVSERPVQPQGQEYKEGHIEHQQSEVLPESSAQTERYQTPWAWEPTKGSKLPGGDPKHPVIHQQPPTSMQRHIDLERVLNDTQLEWPVTVLVDTDPSSLHHTRKQWMAVDEGTLQDHEFNLVTFNDTQVSTARRVGGVAALRRALAVLGGSSGSERGAAFLAVLSASQRSRSRSALLLFTGRPSIDESYGALASQEMSKRGCRLFVWWSGARRFGGSGAERLYRDAVQHTGGSFFDADAPGTERPHNPVNLPQLSWEHTQVILAARESLHGMSRMAVLVDSTVEELHIIILGYVSQAFIRTPSGEDIDLLHGGAATATANGDGDASDGMLERRLNTRGRLPGLWQLTTHDGSGSTGAGSTGAANAGAGYDVIVKGTSGLRVVLQRPAGPTAAEAALNDSGDLVVTVHGGPRANITGLVLLDNKGNELRKTSYKQRTRRDEHDHEVIELSVPQKALELQQMMPHYVKVNGYNEGAGEAFTRITPQISTTGSLIVTLNGASNLTIQPGTQSQVYLDVTNNGSRPSRIYVTGSSSRNILYRVTPSNFQLNPNQRRTVSLQLYAAPNMVGVGDTLKIQVHGDLTIFELFLEMNIADNIYETRDTNRPSLKHRILSDCTEIQSCSSRQWAMEATVQDNGSGIREISSVPEGIIWSPMVIGTKLPITLKYKASCCDESVIITVTDLQHNVARYTVNVNEEPTGLSPGVIAGIVVGALVILIIIIVIIVVVCKKNRTTHTFQTQQVAR